MDSPSRKARKLPASVAWAVCLLALLPACGSERDAIEEHRKLSLRLEHRPPGRAPAGETVEILALVQSSLAGSNLEAWVRVLASEGEDEKIPLEISPGGEGIARLPGRARGEELRYVIEARDAAGLVVALPHGAEDGKAYRIRFEGHGSRVLGGISLLSALLAAFLFLGAGAAAVQNLRGRMSPGPAGMLGGFGAALVLLGVLVAGAVHAYQVVGQPWPSTSLFLSLSRMDLGIVTLLWAANLFLGRRALLEEEIDRTPRGERGFAVVGVFAAALLLFFLLF